MIDNSEYAARQQKARVLMKKNNLDDDTILEPGCIEKDGIYVLEHQVLVTETGCKVLSHAPWEL